MASELEDTLRAIGFAHEEIAITIKDLNKKILKAIKDNAVKSKSGIENSVYYILMANI